MNVFLERHAGGLLWPPWSDGISKHHPGGVSIKQQLGRHHSLLQHLAQVPLGSRSVRVPMLLASIEGSIGIGVPWVRSRSWRTRQQARHR
jgi:hypothetical protein